MSKEKKRSRRQALKELFLGAKDPMDRIRDADVVLRDYGFKPVFETKTLEARRSEISRVFGHLLKLETEAEEEEDTEKKFDIAEKAKRQAKKLGLLFYLFFSTGSPWVRGVDNEWLSTKVSDFIEQYEDIGHLPSFLSLLHAESMQLLHMSWQGIDVTQMPDYIIQVMNPMGNQNQNLPYGFGPKQITQSQEQEASE